MESPEISSGQRGHIEIELRNEPAQYFHIADDVSRRPLSAETQPSLKGTSSVVGAIELHVGASI